MSAKAKLIIDIIERAVFTWLEAFVGLLLAANIWSSTQPGEIIAFLDVVQVAAVAAIPAALAVIKGGLAALIGNRNTAAALPGDVDNGT